MMMNDHEVPRYDESEPSDDNNDNDDDDEDEKRGYVNPNQYLAIPTWQQDDNDNNDENDDDDNDDDEDEDDDDPGHGFQVNAASHKQQWEH